MPKLEILGVGTDRTNYFGQQLVRGHYFTSDLVKVLSFSLVYQQRMMSSHESSGEIGYRCPKTDRDLEHDRSLISRHDYSEAVRCREYWALRKHLACLRNMD